MTERWRVDLHTHTKWSKDSLTEFATIIRVCAKRGIDRIAITDHNTADGALEMKRVAPELVIVGEEIMTQQGELLAYYVQETVPAGLTPEETIKRLREQGAVISVPHPFDRLRGGAWREEDLVRIMGDVDAIEIFNARCIFMRDNLKAAQFAERHHRVGTVGSDAHITREYGTALTLMRPFAHTPEDFLVALQEADYVKRLSSWSVHLGTTMAKWVKRLGLKSRMWEGG